MKLPFGRAYRWSSGSLSFLLLIFHAEINELMLVLMQLGVAFSCMVLYVILELLLPDSFKASLRIVCWSVLTAAVLSLPLIVGIWNIQDATSHNRGEHIVRQLEAYHAHEGRYPDSLTQLVPRYLPKVPSTATSLFTQRPYNYRLSPEPKDAAKQRPDAYWLNYYVGSWTSATYSSLERRWTYTD